MQTKQQVLQACMAYGNLVKIPDVQLDRTLYLEVKTALENIGGKWKGGKVKGFVFEVDPSELLLDLAEGKDRNLKEEYQFFETPPHLADRLVKLANIDCPQLRVLEPSAGRGALIRAITDANPDQTVHCYELQETNRKLLEKMPGVVVVGMTSCRPGAQIFSTGFLPIHPLLLIKTCCISDRCIDTWQIEDVWCLLLPNIGSSQKERRKNFSSNGYKSSTRK